MQPLKTMLLALLLPSLVLMAMATTTETDINETWNVESAQGDGDWMGGGEYFDEEEEEEEEASDGSRLAWMSFRLDDMEERLRSLGADVGRNEEYLIQVLRMQSRVGHDDNPSGCSSLKSSSPSAPSGVYDLSVPGVGFTRAYCHMDGDTGWTVLLRRGRAPRERFDRGWSEYVAGFGDRSGEHWLGLEATRALAGAGRALRIDMVGPNGEDYWIRFANFSVGNSSDDYRLRLGPKVAGNIADKFSVHVGFRHGHNGQRFSTWDRENDIDGPRNCAKKYGGGWWYHECYQVALTGSRPGPTPTPSPGGRLEGVHWHPVGWRDGDGEEWDSMQFVEMAVA